MDSTAAPTTAPDKLVAFFARARHEVERYGDDPFVFVRELVQNSRDAGARAIRFALHEGPSETVLECADDGCGMSADAAQRFLFRLFSSGKEGDAERAGRFGVGFWSVLRVESDALRVETSDGDSAATFVIEPRKPAFTPHAATRQAAGTTISLVWSRQNAPARHAVREAIIKYAGPIRGVGGAAPPDLLLDGERLNRPLGPRGAMSSPLREKGLDGYCGIGARASIRVYSHGLLVKEATSLEELYPRRAPTGQPSHGLFPVASINADDIGVLLDRTRFREDPLLERLVSKIARVTDGLRLEVLEQMAPLSWRQRADLFWLHFSPRRLLAVALSLIVAVAIAGVLWPADPMANVTVETPSPPSSIERTVTDAVDAAAGPVINTPEDGSSGGSGWGLRFSGGPLDADGKVFIKVRTYDRYDAERGLVGALEPDVIPYAYATPGRGETMSVRILVSKEEQLVTVPVPARHRLLNRRSRFLGEPIGGFTEGDNGDTFVHLPPHHGPAVLQYETRLAPHAHTPAAPGATFRRVPKAFAAVVRAARAEKSEARRVKILSDAVAERVRYTTDALDAELFSRSAQTWPERVAAFGAGDCDVMNGFLVLLLRAAGIPAQLGVGFVGEDGAVADQLHAWTEYWVEGWKIIDVSPAQERPRVDLAGDAPSPEPPPSARESDAAGRPLGPAPDGGASARNDVTPPRDQTASRTPQPSAPSVRSWMGPRRVRAGLILIVAVPLLALLLFTRRRRRDEDESAMERCTIALFTSALDDPESALFVRLSKRPFFRRCDGTRVSLRDLDTECQSHDIPLAEDAADRTRFPRALDVQCPRVAALAHRLPHVVRLSVARAWRDSSIHAELTNRIAARLAPLAPGVAVRVVAGDGVETIRLPRGRDDSILPLLIGIGTDHDALASARRFSLSRAETAKLAAAAIVNATALGVQDPAAAIATVMRPFPDEVAS